MENKELSKAIAVLDEIKEEADGLVRRGGYAAAIRISSKATEVQNLLIGERATDPENN